MLSPLLFLALQAAAGPQLPAGATPEARYDQCVDAATTAPEQAEKIAGQWRLVGGGFLARQCLGMSYATRQKWTAAAEAFEQSAAGGMATTAHAINAMNSSAANPTQMQRRAWA